MSNSSPPLLLPALPYLTGDLPGIGGVLKQTPADFVVEEIPLFPPSGAGGFLYLWVQKTGVAAEQLSSHLSRELQLPVQSISQAGLKDRQAVTRQYVCVPSECAGFVEQFRHPAIEILRVDRHHHKLRTGQLRGNRFTITVRDPHPEAETRAREIAAVILRHGLLNFYGEQRFGRENETLLLGLRLLKGEASPGDIPRARRKFLLRLALSAAQSLLFNQALARRFEQNTCGKVQAGDVLQKVASGGLFVCEDPVVDQPRWESGEVAISGPIYGPKMVAPRGDVAAWEEQLLGENGLAASDFTRYPQLTAGTRRPYTIRPTELMVSAAPAALILEFTLPSGSYATEVLREFMKSAMTG